MDTKADMADRWPGLGTEGERVSPMENEEFHSQKKG